MTTAVLQYSKLRWELQNQDLNRESAWVAFAEGRVHFCIGGRVAAIGLLRMNTEKFHKVQHWERAWWYQTLFESRGA